YYSTFAYVSEAKRLGLQIDPPDVALSTYRWTGAEMRVRVGLQAVRDLSRETAEAILAARQSSPFTGLADFLYRVHPADDEMRSLIDAGAMDGLAPGSNRSVLHWQATAGSGQRAAAPGRLFAPAPVVAPSLAPHNTVEQLRREYRALGFLCRHHPLNLVRGAAGRGLVKIGELASCVGRTVQLTGWLLTGKMVATKDGETMEFLTFEDETGLVETTFFPQTYERYAHLLAGQRPYRLSGLVESDYGAVTLTVDRIEPLCR
ncbi:MAG: DNA polymerase III subunit alpha, partial [Desulfofustis sp.]|nr:DNA polymerase III subunit alpha [Desulfofustis sp.]